MHFVTNVVIEVALLSWQEKRGIVIVVEPTIALMQETVPRHETRDRRDERRPSHGVE